MERYVLIDGKRMSWEEYMASMPPVIEGEELNEEEMPLPEPEIDSEESIDFGAMTVKELLAESLKRKLEVTGLKKAELVALLTEYENPEL